MRDIYHVVDIALQQLLFEFSYEFAIDWCLAGFIIIYYVLCRGCQGVNAFCKRKKYTACRNAIPSYFC